MRRTGFARQIMLFAVSSSVTAHSFKEIFERATSCPDSAAVQCNITSIPSNFCCPSTSTCIPLAANTTILCCPTGKNCNQIQQLDCNISLQNVSQIDAENNAVMTTALSIPLPNCGTTCCPHGYSCASNNLCLRNVDQSIAPGVSSTSPLTTKSAVSSSTARSTSTTISISTTIPTLPAATFPASSLNCNATLVKECDKFPIGAVLVGFFPGLVLGVLLALASICLLGAKRRKSTRRRSSSSFGNISEPQPSEHIRTDFLRKPAQTPPSTAGSSTLGRSSTVTRVRSLFGKPQLNDGNEMQQSPRPPVPLIIKKNPQAQHPVTPPMQRQRSYEDVNIFADRDIASSLSSNQRQHGLQPPMVDSRASHTTTMDDVMNLAGLHKGQPYIYRPVYPPTPTPKTRGT